MASQICEERFDLPSPKRQTIEVNSSSDDYASDSPKRQKIEANTSSDDYDSDSPKRQKIKPKTYYDYDECTPEEIQQFDDEWEKSQGFEIDFSKLTYWGVLRPVDLDDSTWGYDSGLYETDRDFIAFLAQSALTQRNADYGTSLKLGKILMANFHKGSGVTFYISFEVNDPSASDGNQTIPFRAVVGYLGRDNLYFASCDPKPSP